MPFSKTKTERKKGSTWEEDRIPGCRSHLYSEKTHVFGQAAFQDFDAAVLTLIYVCDFRDIQNDLDESRLTTWP